MRPPQPRQRINDRDESYDADERTYEHHEQCPSRPNRRADDGHERDIAEPHRFLLQGDFTKPAGDRDRSGARARTDE